MQGVRTRYNRPIVKAEPKTDLTREELENACFSLRRSRDALLKRNEDQTKELARLHAEIARMKAGPDGGPAK